MLQICLIVREEGRDLGYVCIDTEEIKAEEKAKILTLRDIIVKSIFDRLYVSMEGYKLKVTLDSNLPSLELVGKEGRTYFLDQSPCIGVMGTNILSDIKNMALRNGIDILSKISFNTLKEQVELLNTQSEHLKEDFQYRPTPRPIENLPQLGKVTVEDTSDKDEYLPEGEYIPSVVSPPTHLIQNDLKVEEDERDEEEEGMVSLGDRFVFPEDLELFLDDQPLLRLT